jgi:hypothetical protein
VDQRRLAAVSREKRPVRRWRVRWRTSGLGGLVSRDPRRPSNGSWARSPVVASIFGLRHRRLVYRDHEVNPDGTQHPRQLHSSVRAGPQPPLSQRLAPLPTCLDRHPNGEAQVAGRAVPGTSSWLPILGNHFPPLSAPSARFSVAGILFVVFLRPGGWGHLLENTY